MNVNKKPLRMSGYEYLADLQANEFGDVCVTASVRPLAVLRWETSRSSIQACVEQQDFPMYHQS